MSLEKHVHFDCKYQSSVAAYIACSGIPGIDAVLDGGVPVGTLALIEEEPFACISEQILHTAALQAQDSGYFVCCITGGCVAGLQKSLQQLRKQRLNKMHVQGFAANDSIAAVSPSTYSLDIAWRYASRPVDSTTVIGNKNDISTGCNRLAGADCDSQALPIKFIDISTFTDAFSLFDIIQSITVRRDTENLTGAKNQTRFTKFFVYDFASVLWHFTTKPSDNQCSLSSFDQLTRMLFSLRLLLKKCMATVFISLSCGNVENYQRRRLHRLCETVIHISTFSTDEQQQRAAVPDIIAILKLFKAPLHNSLKPRMATQQGNDDVAFGVKIKHGEIILVRLHLPPSLGEVVSEGGGGDRGDISNPHVAAVKAVTTNVTMMSGRGISGCMSSLESRNLDF